MHLFFYFGSLAIPSYGLMIALGVVLANVVAMFVLRKTKLDLNDFILTEAYCILGAFIGAKGLYLIVSAGGIQWNQMLNPSYFNQIMQGGFVFYGGLIGGLLFVCLSGKLHKIDSGVYVRNFIFLIPFIHAFGRVGCFLAGCCYGRPYEGIGAVVFPEGSYAPAGIRLFPVQLVEAVVLFGIALLLLFLQMEKNWYYTIESYFLLYAVARFVLEYFRYDEVRGRFLYLSTSQWISIALVGIAVVSIYRNKLQTKRGGGLCQNS